jgi:hypothetical protein
LESSKSQPNKLQELKEDTSFHYHYMGVPHFAQTFDVERLRLQLRQVIFGCWASGAIDVFFLLLIATTTTTIIITGINIITHSKPPDDAGHELRADADITPSWKTGWQFQNCTIF